MNIPTHFRFSTKFLLSALLVLLLAGMVIGFSPVLAAKGGNGNGNGKGGGKPLPSPSPIVVPSPSPEPTISPTPQPSPVVSPSPAPTVSPTPSPSPEPLFVRITSPNGGEVLGEGTSFRIFWESSSRIDKVSIGYKTCESCLDWIAYNIPNQNYFDWTVSSSNQSVPHQIYIIAYETGVGSVTDVSDGTFTISSPSAELNVSQVSPNQGSVGSLVAVSGSGFGNESGMVVFTTSSGSAYGGVTQSWSDSLIWVSVPGMIALPGETAVTVRTAQGEVSNAAIFTVTAGQPQIDSISPDAALPGEKIAISGSGFGTREGSIRFYDGSTLLTTASVSAWSDSSVEVVLPQQLQPGAEYALQVVTAADTASSVKFYQLGN